MRLLAVLLLALTAVAPAWGGGDATSGGDGLARVEVTARQDVAAAIALLERLGGRIEVQSGLRVQASLPREHLDALRAAESVLRLQRPAWFQPLELGPDATLIGANRWQAAGFTGRGVRIAVIDTGFDGYLEEFADGRAGTVHARSFRFDQALDGGTDHGRQAAAIVREMAPGADLYLLSFSTVTELGAAVDFVLAEEIDVVSFSVGFIHNGPGDGSGAVNEIVNRATNAGVVWTAAAGNWAEQHWAGPFSDVDGDLVHEFAGGEQLNGREFRAGDLITASLRWDDVWGASCSDYDLELFGPDGALVQASREIQDCDGDPVEGVRVLATQDGRYSVRVVAAEAAGEPRTLDLLLLGAPDRGDPLRDFVPAGSLSEPADHPAAVTVGALSATGELALAVFSSRGPTADGRAKPELASPTGLATRVGGSGEPRTQFTGTSAAAPYVAGAVALLMEGLPGADPDAIVAALRARAVALPGEAGGGGGEVGLVQLGALAGLGSLLPAGADGAEIVGSRPPAGGLALVVYRGPDRYPLRFAHLLTGEPPPIAFFRFVGLDESGGGDLRWDRHLVGAPAFVNTFDRLNDGDVLVLRYGAGPQE